jgi:hypothetical protein
MQVPYVPEESKSITDTSNFKPKEMSDGDRINPATMVEKMKDKREV